MQLESGDFTFGKHCRERSKRKTEATNQFNSNSSHTHTRSLRFRIAPTAKGCRTPSRPKNPYARRAPCTSCQKNIIFRCELRLSGQRLHDITQIMSSPLRPTSPIGISPASLHPAWPVSTQRDAQRDGHQFWHAAPFHRHRASTQPAAKRCGHFYDCVLYYKCECLKIKYPNDLRTERSARRTRQPNQPRA